MSLRNKIRAGIRTLFDKAQDVIGRECPWGVTHPRWERICACGFGTEDAEMNHHGGVIDLETGTELVPCTACDPDLRATSNHWHLTSEEQVLVHSWREWREDVLNAYGETLPYRYRILVDLGGARSTLFTRTQGIALLRDADPLATGDENDPSAAVGDLAN